MRSSSFSAYRFAATLKRTSVRQVGKKCKQCKSRTVSVLTLRTPWPPPEPQKETDDAWNLACQAFHTISTQPEARSEQPRLLPTTVSHRACVPIQSKRWQGVMFPPHRRLLVWRNLRVRLSSAMWRGGQMEHGTAGAERKWSGDLVWACWSIRN